jgi:HSP20 family protein
MAVPTRRRDTGRSAQPQETRLPTAWEPSARSPWNVEPLERLRTVSRMLDELTADWPGFGALAGDGFSTPLGDLEELDDAWLLRVELPGVKRDDADIQVAGRRLTVRAERKETERKGILRRTTRTTGRYYLEVVLPGEVDPDDVEATLDDGVLTVRVAKPEAEQGGQRRIAIQGPAGDQESSG